MNMIYKNFAEAYEALLSDVIIAQSTASPRGQDVKERFNVQFTILDTSNPYFKNEIRSSKISYIKKELEWYDSMSNDPSEIAKSAPIWAKIANPDGTVNSNYGRLLNWKEDGKMSQWEWAKESLKKDKFTRQAIMHFNRIEHQVEGIKDFPCTMYGVFSIRNNQLDLTVRMRSNDLIFGLPNDIAYFCLLLHRMKDELLETYPDLTVGTYTHSADNIHIYKEYWDVVMQMLQHPFYPTK